MRSFILVCIVSVLALGIGYASLSQDGTPTAKAQDYTNGGWRPLLLIDDPIDLGVFYETLVCPNLASQYQSLLQTGYACRHLGQERISTSSSGDRNFDAQVTFQNQAGTVQGFPIGYTYNHTSGSNPTIPPDSIQYSPEGGTDTLRPVLLADRVAYDYLVHILTTTPTQLINHLSSKNLVEVWVEKLPGSPETMKGYFKYTAPGVTQTILVWAYHYGNSSFGALTVVE